jgi:hypothetical protein
MRKAWVRWLRSVTVRHDVDIFLICGVISLRLRSFVRSFFLHSFIPSILYILFLPFFLFLLFIPLLFSFLSIYLSIFLSFFLPFTIKSTHLLVSFRLFNCKLLKYFKTPREYNVTTRALLSGQHGWSVKISIPFSCQSHRYFSFHPVNFVLSL